MSTNSMTWDEERDVVVAGSGAAGMCAALVSRLEGLDSLLVEKTSCFGGTTALSGGAVWIPTSHLAARVGIEDSRTNVLTYLRNVLGPSANESMLEAFLTHGPLMVEYLEKRTCVKFAGRAYSPDYLPDVAGASLGGRAMDPLEFDGRLLGEHFDLLRKPWPEFLAFGGMMVNKTDIDRLLSATRSWTGFRHAVRLLARYARDRISYSRGTRLVLGNALAARLYRALLDAGVTVWRNAPVTKLCMADERVIGVEVERDGNAVRIRAKLGVVLATGGFPANLELRRSLLPHPTDLWSAGNEANTGDGLQIALANGAVLGTRNSSNAFWSPVSLGKRRDGSTIRFPHLMLDRYKPGVIAVNARGRRFVNEADSYHAFGEAMQRADAEGPSVPAFLICDARFIRKYGLGLVRPGASRLRQLLDAGYLAEGRTFSELANRLGIDAANLEQTVRHYNEFAARGEDPEFGKGSNAYNRYLGDPAHKPNPCLAPIDAAPFYGVRVFPGDLGTSCGLEANGDAQVLRADGTPIEGLYVCGNDMNSIMVGRYPGPGATLGPGLTFGYAAAMHMASRAATAKAIPRAREPRIPYAEGTRRTV